MIHCDTISIFIHAFDSAEAALHSDHRLFDRFCHTQKTNALNGSYFTKSSYQFSFIPSLFLIFVDISSNLFVFNHESIVKLISVSDVEIISTLQYSFTIEKTSAITHLDDIFHELTEKNVTLSLHHINSTPLEFLSFSLLIIVHLVFLNGSNKCTTIPASCNSLLST
ncbi:MAG: hypothetical protein Q8S84_01825 [bacterium]|nr:hypothetical protein [bacterium]